jgi:diketogulonate reductase-like aldo/keto reductase
VGLLNVGIVHLPWNTLGWVSQKNTLRCRDRSLTSRSGVRHLTNLPSPKPAVNQIEVHPFCQQRDIVEYCQKNGIVIQAYSPLILADKAKWGNETLVSISKKHERDIAQVLLRWSLQKG